MEREEFEILEFQQRIRSGAFNEIARKSMNEWRILMGIKRGRISDKTYRYLWNIAEYFGEGEGLEEIRFLGLEPPEHADDIVDLIQNAPTFDELDAIRFAYQGYKPLRKRRNPYESYMARQRNNRH